MAERKKDTTRGASFSTVMEADRHDLSRGICCNTGRPNSLRKIDGGRRPVARDAVGRATVSQLSALWHP